MLISHHDEKGFRKLAHLLFFLNLAASLVASSLPEVDQLSSVHVNPVLCRRHRPLTTIRAFFQWRTRRDALLKAFFLLQRKGFFFSHVPITTVEAQHSWGEI